MAVRFGPWRFPSSVANHRKVKKCRGFLLARLFHLWLFDEDGFSFESLIELTHFFYGFVLTLLRNFHWLFLPVIYGWIQSIRVVPFRVSWTCKLGRFSLPSRWLKDSLMLSTNQKINKNPETMEIRFIKKWLMVSDWNRTEWVELPQVWGCRTAFTQLFSQVGYSLGSATAISSFPPRRVTEPNLTKQVVQPGANKVRQLFVCCCWTLACIFPDSLWDRWGSATWLFQFPRSTRFRVREIEIGFGNQSDFPGRIFFLALDCLRQPD